eukprot:Hpha_TRINITY_DN16178_c4_g7::TRINITY_DN16178_c4_g7_i1::g.6478::m.6478
MKTFCWRKLARPGDSREDATIKEVIFPIFLALSALAAYAIFGYLQKSYFLAIVGVGINLVAMTTFIVISLVNCVRARYLVDAVLSTQARNLAETDTFQISI